MNGSTRWALAAAFALATASALAQPGSAASAPGAGAGIGAGMGAGSGQGAGTGIATGSGRGMGPGTGAGMSPGAGRGMGPGRGGMARWGDGVTPGWALMSPEERTQHQQTMRGFGDVGECRAYVRRHHAEMAARALSQDRQIPPTPRRDACAGLAR